MADIDDGMDEAVAAFSKLPPIGEAPREDEDAASDGGDTSVDGEGDDADVNDEAGDEQAETDEQDEEPELPAIDAPASWDAEAKKVFASLPPAAQQIIADRESHREKAINAKASEAAQARKQADGLVSEYSNLHRTFADELDTYAKAIQPQRPDWSLAASDPQAFAAQMAYFEATSAQLNQIQQQSAQARQQAEQIEQQQLEAFQREEAKAIVEAIPDMADPAKAKALWDDFSATAKELGYPEDLINQARAVDVVGLKTATEWRSKAAKWDALQATKMASVREAKGKPKVAIPGTAQPKAAVRAQRAGDAMNRLRSSGDIHDAAAAIAAILG